MVKKFKNDEIFIKGLLDSGSKPAEILKKYKKKIQAFKFDLSKAELLEKNKF